ncbi:aspartate/glutamate racemase family protein [Rhodovibrio salinarum]|uniref:Hydantoin racemase n=1 Tax=Rhodovibrio salinarum TaxID=1087 RepID=A0A934V0P7_9PROT|nr:aspartate/glutamate racemase family protein [Rhodovibrio salinarum]MBK1698158.1 Asp/Glu/hydantoin racemase [Rhodovibrio salinarum]
MRITVINPNTSVEMTRIIGDAATRAASPNATINAVNPDSGPPAIENHYDEAVATVPMLEMVRDGEANGVNGFVIACFGDPGLNAAREVATGPVIGIAEAAMHAASMLATGFSVVTSLERTCVIAEHLVQRYGMREHCRSIYACEIPVLGLLDDHGAAWERIVEKCRQARDTDGAGAIVLGCAGMADLTQELTNELGIPVIDGVSVAVRFVEALAGAGLATSKHGDLAYPIPKNYTGEFARLSPGKR